MGNIESYRKVLESTLGIPFSVGNEVEVLKNGKEIFPAMIEAIRQAEHRIDFLTYVYWSGNIAYRFAKELAKKADEGVQVRVILDSIGAAFMPGELTQLLEQSDVEIEWFRPLPKWKIWQTDNRTHRKVLICDGDVAFTGGVGIAEEWEGDARNPNEWRETHFKIKGPAVFGLNAAFMENWIETGRDIELETDWDNGDANPAKDTGNALIQVIRTSASVRWSDIVMLYQTLLRMATSNIRITTAYFNPNDTMVQLLKEASRRGVTVDIMMPGKHIDKRVAEIAGADSFESLMQAEVRLWYYQRTMLHSKIITIDDTICCVGSANFNHRSMLKDDEVNMVIMDQELTSKLNNHFSEDLKHCEKVEEGRWKRRSFVRKSFERLTNLFKQQI